MLVTDALHLIYPNKRLNMIKDEGDLILLKWIPSVISEHLCDINFQPHYGPAVDSAYNRNEYKESSWVVKGGRRVGLTTLPLSVSRLSRRCLEDAGASTSHNPIGVHSLLQG
jgi:hypothetical protein